MPMMDIDLPAGVHDEAGERVLLAALTDALIRWEGADPANARVQSLAWVFVHRGTDVYIAGKPATAPHYRVRVSVPQGQFDDERRAGMIAAVTDAILDAEAGRFERDPMRVWVFPTEIPEGTWGAAGQVWRLRDIAGHVFNDAEKGRAYALRTLNKPQKAVI
jgi:phenylpyruvate tautomerase PptA (4-oxalocrotonate tautomerase family)